MILKKGKKNKILTAFSDNDDPTYQPEEIGSDTDGSCSPVLEVNILNKEIASNVFDKNNNDGGNLLY